MNTRPFLLFLPTIFAAASLACSLGGLAGSKIERGSTQTFTLHEPHPATGEVVDVHLSISTGQLSLTGGSDSLLEGEVRYNVAAWRPTLTNQNHSLTVSQGEPNATVVGLPDEDVVNVWDVRLGDVPMNLSLRALDCDATLDLSGVALQRLDIRDGASTSAVRFDTPNPEEMHSLRFHTGASDITFHGLANANFTEMTFEGGAGDYMFDFSGELRRDATVNIKVGLSNVQILVPPGVSARVFVKGRPGSVSSDGAWTQKSDHFANGADGPQLTITVEMAAGSLQLGHPLSG
jgi:hypothetical protein